MNIIFKKHSNSFRLKLSRLNKKRTDKVGEKLFG